MLINNKHEFDKIIDKCLIKGVFFITRLKLRVIVHFDDNSQETYEFKSINQAQNFVTILNKFQSYMKKEE